MMEEFEDIRVFPAGENDSGKRLDTFLAEVSGISRSKIKKLIDDGFATVNDSIAIKPSFPVSTGDTIELAAPSVTEPPNFLPENLPLDIIFEDTHLLVVNKPAGMVVHPGCGNVTGTLASALLYHCKNLSGRGGEFRPGIVHRLDMNTSGLLVIALDDETHALLSKMISERTIKRIYTAFVWGHPHPQSGTVDAPIGRHPNIRTLKAVDPEGRPALTHYETTHRYAFLSQLEVSLETGRTHQIRVHMAHIGHHVFGDPSYGGREDRLKGYDPEIRERARRLLKELDRQALHAARLEFVHPFTGKEMVFEAEFPADMKRIKEKLDEER
ncbi:MAG: RluA family pseudouridine synthase [Candidatus Latescibacterota bacterium]